MKNSFWSDAVMPIARSERRKNQTWYKPDSLIDKFISGSLQIPMTRSRSIKHIFIDNYQVALKLLPP